MKRLLLLIAGACLLSAPAAASSSDAVRPVKGTCETTFTIGFDPVAGLPAADIAGVCRFTHLGLATYAAHQLLYPDGSVVNDSVYTAANGDRLFAHATGAGVATGPTTLALQFEEWYTGGTGRFANVVTHPLTGPPDVTGTAAIDVAAGTGRFSSTGTIGY